MQITHSPPNSLFLPLQSNEPLPSWSLDARLSTERGPMDIGGLLSGNARQTTNGHNHLRHPMHQNLAIDNHYALAHNANSSVHSFGMDHPANYSRIHQSQIVPNQAQSPKMNLASPKARVDPIAKTFTCSNNECNKKFARKSDLARHERIHSGDKPHICEYPGCGKKFIQRSALTVHTRVHTGEKPHLCEQCAKPFSDSSSLARHRRIHLGLKPYTCPYVNCQKTFTRKTTMTRHQSACGGIISHNEAHTKMKLSHSLNSSFSVTQSSRGSTASPRHSTSVSSTNEIPQIPIHKPSDYSYLHGQSYLPQLHSEYVHTRPDHLGMPTLTSFVNIPQHRPRPVVPSSYAPPQPLEPPTTGSAGSQASPYPLQITWDQMGLSNSNTMDFMNIYPDPHFGSSSMYYGGRQSQNAGPEDWSLPSSHLSNNQYNSHMQFNQDWSGRPLSRELKHERAFAT